MFSFRNFSVPCLILAYSFLAMSPPFLQRAGEGTHRMGGKWGRGLDQGLHRGTLPPGGPFLSGVKGGIALV